MKTSHLTPLSVAKIFVAATLGAVCGLSGCVSRPPLNKQTFAFGTPAVSGTKGTSADRVLGIRTLQIAAPFEGRSLVYRTGEFSYERDPYAEFLEPPTEGLIAPVREGLVRDGRFRAVVDAGSALKPDTLAEISVSQLFGDFRQREHPAAVMTTRFVFVDAPNGVPGKALFQKEYSRSIPLSAPSPAELMKGWNQALAGILAEVGSDFQNRMNVKLQQN